MAIRHLDAAPKTEDFTPLQEHQEQTPTTFFGAKPVLYARYPGLTLSAPASQLQQDAAFFRFNTENEGEDVLIKDVEIFVNANDLILFQTTPTSTGVSIPYPSIALHATMKYKSTVEALYMNLSLNDADAVNDEEEIQTLELTILPPSYSSNPDTACIKEIFNAMNTCADLHPDEPGSDDEGNNVLDETAPGASGWITAENMDEYMDEDGNFRGTVIGGEELGPGAGTVRTREEAEDDVNGVNGDGHGDKYHRTG
ncbi:regulator of volume decrease after cellular swelling-domain-containing protein [Paraphoma chrysanthemicola]|uniref:Regulator of volume decrease after cellular swelling-domain-containing protein n=1 Tax=Paraphoma chrysanthemicola TaxID=798071 RepID=A0A8K0VW14_9PLEO|nr:regulator of volume decrease after cellular swelling-domain-containing protein [Paraphoma chrysanthemicola]